MSHRDRGHQRNDRRHDDRRGNRHGNSSGYQTGGKGERRGGHNRRPYDEGRNNNMSKRGEECTEYELPYNTKERSPNEHFSRHLHRLTVMPRNLTKVISHWADVETGTTIPSIKEITTVSISSKHLTWSPDDSTASEENPVEVKALLVNHYSDTKSRHAMKYYDLIACKNLCQVDKPVIEAYGGAVPKDDDAAMREFLTKRVKDHLGVDIDAGDWVRFVEFQYTDPVRKVVFFTPNTPQKYEMHVRSAVDDTPQTADEEILEQLDNEAPRTVKQQPTTVPMCNLVEQKIGSMPQPTVELALAADSLNEYLRRENASAVLKFLKEHVVRKRELDQEASERRDLVADLKRKKTDVLTERKKARTDQDAENKKEWEKIVWGLTLDEKRDILKVKENELSDERKVEDAKTEKQFKKDCDAVGTMGGKYEFTNERDEQAYSAFQYFDKQKGSNNGNGMITKQKLCGIFLSLPEPRTINTAMTLLNESAQGLCISYRHVTTIRKKVEVQPKPEEPKQEEESKDAEMPEKPEGAEA
eukprot:TRINITY_DN21176_c0_g1_i1.p1 TRINITY_DN21176_c0_g1~~TRINITY_DN21176_c0_g1_i1.p1  ORF type:complete len:537 (+),score=112.30 TRINITY_DN21176_c0_g1_i1:27-1613(+)